jgi:hypothetical protein
MAERGTHKITAKLIAELKPERGDYIQYDTDVRGFGVRVTKNGITAALSEH